MKINPKTIVDFLDNSCRLFPNKTALVFGKNKYSYLQLKEKSDQIAAHLGKKIRRGEVVGLLLSNRPEFIVSYFAVFKAKGVVLLLDQGISDGNLIQRILDTGARFLLSEGKYRTKILRANLSKKIDFIDVTKQNFEPAESIDVSVQPNDVSTIIYTSGATSAPKAARLRHYNVVAATCNIADFLDTDEADIDVNISSLSHSFGLGHIHTMLASGATIILFKNSIDLAEILKTIVKYKATTFAATPAILRVLASHFRREFKLCGRYLRLIQTNISPLEPELVKDILELLPKTKFCYYYGLSEASRATFFTFNNNLEKIRSVGKPMPNVEIKIVNSRGRKTKIGKSGEICIRGKIVIRDYWKNTQANKRIKNGWFHTGDYGFIDRDGFLFFQGRRDDIINVSGEKVFPEEVEECIRNIPGVVDAAVVGMPDKFLGECVKAYVVVEKKFDQNLIIQICRQKLESYKIPRVVQSTNQIPRTDNGKLRRNILRTAK